jgi:RimJ/RimL family protein N-acetyltransferase
VLGRAVAARGVVTAAPARVVDGDTVVRRFTVVDAPAVAAALAHYLEYLQAWMPWARPEVADEAFQHDRMLAAAARYDDDAADWEFAVCNGAGELVGACGILVRDGRPRVWYWVAHDEAGHGHATRAARLVGEVWRAHRHEPVLEIRCDPANTASAAIPPRLGYRLERVDDTPPETPCETGRTMVWALDR